MKGYPKYLGQKLHSIKWLVYLYKHDYLSCSAISMNFRGTSCPHEDPKTPFRSNICCLFGALRFLETWKSLQSYKGRLNWSLIYSIFWETFEFNKLFTELKLVWLRFCCLQSVNWAAQESAWFTIRWKGSETICKSNDTGSWNRFFLHSLTIYLLHTLDTLSSLLSQSFR